MYIIRTLNCIRNRCSLEMFNLLQLALLCLMMSGTISQADESNPCPGGYDVKSTILGSCYLIGNFKMNWFEAETFCISTGGHLVDIASLEELCFLREILQRKGNDGDGVWIGGNDIGKQGTWRWAGSNKPMDDSLWDKSKNQPNVLSDRCANLYKPYRYSVCDDTCYNNLLSHV